MSPIQQITPRRVGWTLFWGMLLTLLGLALKETGVLPQWTHPWEIFVDLVTLLSLAITVLVLRDLQRIEQKYLFKARAPNLLNRLEHKGDQLRNQLTEADPGDIKETIARTDAVLEDIQGVVQNQALKRSIESLRVSMQEFHPEEDDGIDILAEMRGVEERIIGLIEQSQREVR